MVKLVRFCAYIHIVNRNMVCQFVHVTKSDGKEFLPQ